MHEFKTSFYTILWVLWGVYFAAVEGCALFGLGSRYGTLSQHLWHLQDKRGFWAWFIPFILVWLLVHLVTRGKHA